MEIILLSLVAILGVFIALKFKGLFHRVISIGLAISVLLALTGNPWVKTLVFYAFTLLLFAIFVYSFKVKGLRKIEKISITSMGLILFLSSVFKLFHLPGGAPMKLLMLVPIILTLGTFLKYRRLTKEMGFMLFCLVYAIFELARVWTFF